MQRFPGLFAVAALSIAIGCDADEDGADPIPAGSTSVSPAETSEESTSGAPPSTSGAPASTTAPDEPQTSGGDPSTTSGPSEESSSGEPATGGEVDLPPAPRVRVATLDSDSNSFVFEEAYAIGSGPADLDPSRWALLDDGAYLRLYFMPEGRADEVYQFALRETTGEFEFGYQSIAEIGVSGAPSDSTSSFAMAYDGSDYWLYTRSSDSPTAYAFGFDPNVEQYVYGFDSAGSYPVSGAPASADWSGWAASGAGSGTALFSFSDPQHDAVVQFVRPSGGANFAVVEPEIDIDLASAGVDAIEQFAVVQSGAGLQLFVLELE